MDPSLNVENQVSKVAHTCYLALRDIGQIKRYLTVEATK